VSSADCMPDAGATPQDLTDSRTQRSNALDRVFERITTYEQQLSESLIRGLREIQGLRILGITDTDRLNQRVPTISFTLKGTSPRHAAEWLAGQGLYVWNGNHYALPFTEAAGLEPGGTIRAGALHYNTPAEVQRLVTAVRDYQAMHV
jgi:selenocysteine lyase/cysteine desulfurase